MAAGSVIGLLGAMIMGGAMAATVSLGMDSEPWWSINDGVMGGLSSGRISRSGEGLVFAGELSLENNGGFASVRRPVDADLSAASGVRLRVRGDGRRYQFRLRLDGDFDGIAWRAEFGASGEWQTLELPFGDFEPVFRGRRVLNAGPVVPARIRQVGLMVADRQAGAFRLEIAAIEFY